LRNPPSGISLAGTGNDFLDDRAPGLAASAADHRSGIDDEVL